MIALVWVWSKKKEVQMMSKQKIKKAITSMLKEVTNVNVYYHEAPLNTEYPYAVFNIRERYLTEGLYSNTLSVDVYALDIKTLDDLEDRLKMLNDRTYSENDLTFDIELNTVNTLKNESIYHLNMLFYLNNFWEG